jgi:hypothetical protein
VPLALVLQDALATFRAILHKEKGISRFTPFGQLAIIDEKLVERARSAFLVNWFGSGLPYVHLGLVMHIDNIDALRQRYQAVAAQVRKDEAGPNFTEPLAGVAGAAAGTLVSPAGMLSLLIVQFRRTSTILAILIGMLWGPVIGLLAFWMSFLGAAVGTIAFPAAFAGAIYAGQVYDLLGALAVFSGPLVELIKQLTGPRDKVKNPLLRHILEVADRLAAVFALAIGFIAVVVVRIAPALAPLATQIGPLVAMAGQVRDTTLLIFDDVVSQLTALFIAEKSPFQSMIRVFEHLGTLASKPIHRLRALFSAIGDVFTKLKTELAAGFSSWKTAWKVDLKAMFKAHPLIRLFDAIKMIASIKWPDPRPAAARPPQPGPGFFGKLWQGIKDSLTQPFRDAWNLTVGATLSDWAKRIPKSPGFKVPDVDDVTRRAGGEPVFPLWEPKSWEKLFPDYPTLAPGKKRPVAEWATKAVDLASQPPNLFAPPPLDLGALAETDHKLRVHFVSVIERVLPPLLRKHLPSMLDVFKLLDDELYASDEERTRRAKHPPKQAKPEFPTLDLDDTKVLFPVVRKLRVVVRGGYEPEVRSFRDKLDAALHGRTYGVT